MTKQSLKTIATKAVSIFLLLCLGLSFSIAVEPPSSYALETIKCTARPNSDDTKGNVLGGKETRVTWEGQCATDESLSGLSLTFPEGTEFRADDARVTALTGENLMTREEIDATFIADGQTLIATFTDDIPSGRFVRLEVYGVFFPRTGGEMQLTGTFSLSDGTTAEIAGISPITVTSSSIAQSWADSLSRKAWVQKWNSNKFLRLFLNPPILVTSFPIVFKGFLMALAVVALAFPIAIPIGFLLSLMRISKRRILRGIATTYVNVIRGTPLFLQIYIAFFGLPLAGISVPNYPLGVIVLSLNSSAYLCEIFRAGIQSIPKGQFEASRSLGMNGRQTMLSVIIPQMLRRVLPTMTSEFILLYKDTSLLAAVGFMEVVMYAKTIVAATGSITPYIVAACFYLVITLPMAKFVGKFENRLATGDVVQKKKRKKRNGFGNGGDDGADMVLTESGLESVEDVGITPEEFSSM